VIHVYALTEATRAMPRLEGIAGRPVTELAVAPLAAAFSTHRDADELAVSEECLWAHERVVEALMAERAVLPVRFGAAFGDERALTAALEPRREELARDLERVRDRVELGVRIRVDAPDARPRSGRDYLAGRLDERSRIDGVHQRLAALAHESSVTLGARGLTASYLVERGAVERFAAEADRAAGEVAGVDVVCTGPWPPYSFVGAAA